jgi:Putative zinc-finger
VSHLGRWLSALVDGELDGMERDRVLNHVAGCDACRQEANAMRALKRRLTALGETCFESPIASRLIELARRDEDLSVGFVRDSASWPTADLRPMTVRVPRQTRPSWKVATGSAASALMAIAFAAFLLGNAASGPPAPRVTPSVDSYLLQHSRDAGQEPAGAVGNTGGTAGYAGGGRYRSHHTGAGVQVPVDPSQIGSVHLGQLAAPARAPRPGSAASASASPRPLASATASPAASGTGRSGGSARSHPASLSSK